MTRFLAFFAAIALLATLNAGPGRAVEPDEVLADPVLEARAREISKELRCVVCQNQSIDDSHAGIARDLRILVRERLVAGDSDEQAVDFIVARYGDYVLLRPPFNPRTWALWIGPPVMIGAILFLILLSFRTWQRQQTETGTVDRLSPSDHAELDALVERIARETPEPQTRSAFRAELDEPRRRPGDEIDVDPEDEPDLQRNSSPDTA